MQKCVSFDKTFAKAMNAKAEKLQITSQYIAKRLGVSTTIVSFYRTGKRLPSCETALHLAKILLIEPDKALSLRFESVVNTVKQHKEEAPDYCKNEVALAAFLKDNKHVLNYLEA